jgi:anti-sigma factor RsiW
VKVGEKTVETGTGRDHEVSCPHNASLLALHAGQDVPAEQARRLRRHLDGCADCRLLLSELRATRDWLRANATPPVDARQLDELRSRVVRRLVRERPFPWLLALLGRTFSSWRSLNWQSARGLAVAALLMVGALGALPSLDGHRGARSAWRAAVPASALPAPAAVATDEAEPGDDDESATLDSEPAAEEEVAEAEPVGGPLDAGVEEPSSGSGLRIEMQTTDPNVRIIWFAANTESPRQGIR